MSKRDAKPELPTLRKVPLAPKEETLVTPTLKKKKRRIQQPRDEDNLTDRQAVFATVYPAELAARGGKIGASRAAARAAGYSGNESKLLENPDVKRVVARNLNRHLTHLDATVENIIRQAVRLAFFDPRLMFNDDGTVKQISELDDDTAMAIQSFDVERRTEKVWNEDSEKPEIEVYYVLKPRMGNRNHALELLMKYRKLLDGSGDDRRRDRLDEVIRAMRGE